MKTHTLRPLAGGRLLWISLIGGLLASPAASGRAHGQSCTPASPDGSWSWYELWPIDTWMSDPNPQVIGEIVHMAVLPGVEDQALFFTRTIGHITSQIVDCGAGAYANPSPPINCANDNFDELIWGRSFRWEKDAGGRVYHVPVPASMPQDGSKDFFCGYHTVLADGSVLVVNGTDAPSGCGGTAPYGSTGAYRLDLSDGAENAEWVTMAGGSVAPLPRWYPTALELADGSVLVLGHTGFPHSGQPEKMDLLVPSTPAWYPGISNEKFYDGACGSELLYVYDYPRIHQLASGHLVWTSARSGGAVDESWFLDMVAPYPHCSEPRWVEARSSAPATSSHHINGSSVHLITWDSTAEEYTELLYVIGGAAEGVAGIINLGDCDGKLNGAGINGVVERMVLDPDSTAQPNLYAAWEPVDSLTFARVNHNSVLLLDGSILVVGGVDWDDTNDTCAWINRAERLMPEEVIESGTAATWECLAEATIERQYHSVAAVLPDGTVGVAGGQNLPVEFSDWCRPDHSVEVFTPPYHELGTLPAIAPAFLSSTPYPYDEEFTFRATIPSGANLDRVALVRPGAPSHAFDATQLYIELPVPDPPAGSGTKIIDARMPPNGFYAPPGYYLLVVIDDAGRPSPGQWIQLGT